MKKLSIATVVASGLAAVLIGLAAPVQAAPSGPGSAAQTIAALQAQGYTVIVNQVGSVPLDQASVVAVRPGQSYERFDRGVPGADQPTKTVVNRTVYVDVR